MPVVGNHNYSNSINSKSKTQPYFDYFSAKKVFSVGFKQPAAPVPNKKKDDQKPDTREGRPLLTMRGSWHIVALNSNCNKVGGCQKPRPQGKWLGITSLTPPGQKKSQCTLAYFHHPLYSTGNNVIKTLNVKPL